MTYQAPGFFANGQAVDERTARTEILARAFSEAAGGYFERRHRYEKNIESAKDRRDTMKKYGIAAGIVGGILALLGVPEGNGALILVGLGVGLCGDGYAYMQYNDAQEKIETQQQKLRENEPDGSVSFVSKVTVPFHLVSYDEKYMIFDGLENAPRTSINLTHINGDTIIEKQNQLNDIVGTYHEQISGEGVMQPDQIEATDDEILEHRQLERPIANKIEQITEVIQNSETETIDVAVHANSGISRSIQQLAEQDGLRQSETTPTVETTISREECEGLVTDIRGFESEAVAGDILDQVESNRETVLQLTEDFVNRLQTNQETVNNHFETYEETLREATGKSVCKECLKERLEEIDNELTLINEILSAETGSFGMALDDSDLDKIDTTGGRTFREQIRSDIRQKLPELNGDLRRAFNTLPDISENGFCMKHQTSEIVQVPQSGKLFGEVWRSLYLDFRNPIMDQIEKLEQEAESVRQNKEQKMIDLAQYEQIKDSTERQFYSVKSEYEAAKKIERRV